MAICTYVYVYIIINMIIISINNDIVIIIIIIIIIIIVISKGTWRMARGSWTPCSGARVREQSAGPSERANGVTISQLWSVICLLVVVNAIAC